MRQVLNFERLGPCFYLRGEFRPPKRGEYYLSGAIVEAWLAPNDLPTAWLAPNDLPTSYWIVTPTHKAVASQVYMRGERIREG